VAGFVHILSKIGLKHSIFRVCGTALLQDYSYICTECYCMHFDRHAAMSPWAWTQSSHVLASGHLIHTTLLSSTSTVLQLGAVLRSDWRSAEVCRGVCLYVCMIICASWRRFREARETCSCSHSCSLTGDRTRRRLCVYMNYYKWYYAAVIPLTAPLQAHWRLETRCSTSPACGS